MAAADRRARVRATPPAVMIERATIGVHVTTAVAGTIGAVTAAVRVTTHRA